GKSISLRTDNGRSAYRFDVSEKDLAKISSNSQLFATRIPSKGRPSNIIVFHAPSPSFTRTLLASDQSKKLAKEISIRYGIFIKKGLSICINGHRCENSFPAISNDKILFRI